MSTRAKAIAAILLATFGWGMTPVFIRLLGNPSRLEAFAGVCDLDPFTQTVGRYGAALLVLLAISLFRRKMRPSRLEGRLWLWMLIPAAPNIALQVCWVGAFYFLMPTVGSLLAKLSLITSLGFAYVFFHDERRLIGSWRFIVMAALTLGSAVGVVLASPRLEFAVVGVGSLLIVGSSTFWALYSVGIKYVLGKRPVSGGGAFLIAAVYMVAAFAVLTAIWGDYGRFARVGWRINCLIFLSGCVNIAVPHMLYFFAIRHLGVALVASVTLCTTLVTAVLSYMVFGELLTVGQVIFGIALVGSAGGALWIARGRRPATIMPKPTTPP